MAIDILNMTDEQLDALDPATLNLDEAPAEEPASNDEPPAQVEEPVAEPETPTPEAGAEGEGGEGGGVEEGAEGDDENAKPPETADLSDADLDKTPEAKEPKKKKDEPKPKEIPAAEKPAEIDPAAAAGDKPTDEPKPKDGEAVVVDHKTEYEKIIGVPITANGKKITLKSADEALRLIQQGAGYAQKMQELKPARKSAAMLEAAGLLGNEEALAQMIDLYKGDPKAIAKMLKETNTDVFTLDLEAGAQYTPESHLQSDAAVTFTDTLKEIRNLDGGREAMALIDGMDQASKDMLWGNSEAIRQVYEYKQSGVYDTVATELERRRVLGQLPEGVPYIVAFQKVGEEIAKAQEAEAPRAFAEQNRTPPAAEPAKPAPRAPIATGVAPRKVEAPNAAAVAAAAPRSGSGAAKPVQNIYNLTDAEIERMSSIG